MPPGSPNLDPISNQKVLFCTLVFRPDLHTHLKIWPNLGCTRLSDSGGNFPVSSRFFFLLFFSCSRFLNSADPTISEPGTGRLGLIRQKLCHHNYIRILFEFAYFYFVLIHLELKMLPDITSDCYNRTDTKMP